MFRDKLTSIPLAAACVAGLSPAPADAAPGDLLYAWMQFNASGQPVVRAVLDAPATLCPDLRASTNRTYAMSIRGTAPAGFSEIIVCEGAVDPGASGLTVGHIDLPDVPTNMASVLVIGDTGCRIKGDEVQNCNGKGVGPVWPYDKIARAAAKEDVDIIIHVGDYHYREFVTPCAPESDAHKTCQQAHQGFDPATLGFTWTSWEADFFQYSQPLFSDAAWVMTRGNHENCNRGWRGWFYLMDPRPLPSGPWPDRCPSLDPKPSDPNHAQYLYTDPYAIQLGDTRIIVMDTSYIEDDYAASPSQGAVDQYAGEFTAAQRLADAFAGQTWLVSHRPFWAVASYVDTSTNTPAVAVTDATLQAALAKTGSPTLSDVDLVLSGHVHLFEFLDFGKGRPPQLVAGNSGTLRDIDLQGALKDATDQALKTLGATTLHTTREFDFAVLTSAPDNLDIAIRNVDGDDILTFSRPK